MPDWGRIQKFSGGLEELIWRNDFGGLLGGFGDVPAGGALELPDGNIALPLLSGEILLFDGDSGTLYDSLDLSRINPPFLPDPQFGWAKVLLRNALAGDGKEFFALVNGEILRFAYSSSKREIKLMERADSLGFSSSTPTLDIKGKRLFIVTFDPNSEQERPMLRCFDYSTNPITHRWSIETDIGFTESEDQLTVTYLPAQKIIINNSLYGHLSAYKEEEREGGVHGVKLWTTRETIGLDVAAYISAATQPDGVIYFVENFSRTLYALDGETGEVLWTYPLGYQSIKTPIPHKGRLYIDHNFGLIALQ